jgi:hypothetical protein
VAGRGRPHLCIENLSAPRRLAPSVVSASHQSSGRKTQRPRSHTLMLSMQGSHHHDSSMARNGCCCRTDGATRVTPATRTCGSNKAGLDQPTPTVALVANLGSTRSEFGLIRQRCVVPSGRLRTSATSPKRSRVVRRGRNECDRPRRRAVRVAGIKRRGRVPCHGSGAVLSRRAIERFQRGHGTLLDHSWSGSPCVDAVVTALVLQLPNVQLAPRADRSVCDAERRRLWRRRGTRPV